MTSTTHTALIGPIGVVGLGNMGLEVARRLAAQFDVLGADLSDDRRAEAAAVGIATATLAELTATCPTIVMSLPAPAASLGVANAIAAAPGVVTCVIETSTVTPADVLASARALEASGIAMIDAAILAGVQQMTDGTAGLVIAGDSDHISRLAPVFDAMTPNQTILGASGTAMAAKVINNAVAHVVMVLLSESIALAQSSGLDSQTIVDILAAPDGGLMRPLTHRVQERVFDGRYEGGMSLEAARKDSVLAQLMAQSSGIPIFTIPAAHAVYEMAMAEGWAREDYASLAKLWEQWGATSFKRGAENT